MLLNGNNERINLFSFLFFRQLISFDILYFFLKKCLERVVVEFTHLCHHYNYWRIWLTLSSWRIQMFGEILVPVTSAREVSMTSANQGIPIPPSSLCAIHSCKNKTIYQSRLALVLGKFYKLSVKCWGKGRSPWMASVFSLAFSFQPLPL